MLFLVFQLGKDRYAIEAHQVIEILHLVNVKQIPRAPAGVAGVFDYHGASVPLMLMPLTVTVFAVPTFLLAKVADV